ncbi:MAG: hypothetical protein N838_09055 [Thiohalocapsa sp. PB-PSB1]|jgi:large subunit ribosomal protein L30|nr:MAG: hypothetical protein N838_09055 [Thiohalocapsa sp. PB-PSB1]
MYGRADVRIENIDMSEKKIMKVKQVRSIYGRNKKHRACVRGLGLRRMHQVVEVEDTAATRGMLNRVSYMVELIEEA